MAIISQMLKHGRYLDGISGLKTVRPPTVNYHVTQYTYAMPEFNSPLEIARETLRRLAMERVPPTPENYRTYYTQIAGTEDDGAFPAQAFRRIISQLPSTSAPQLMFVRQFEQAVSQRSWPPLARALIDLCGAIDASNLAWGPLLVQLVEQLGRPHAHLTQAQKRESLEEVIKSARSDVSVLHSRLTGLVHKWASAAASDARHAQTHPGGVDHVADLPTTAATGRPEAARQATPEVQFATSTRDVILVPELGAELESFMHRGIRSWLGHLPALAQSVDLLGARMAASPTRPELPELRTSLSELALKLEWAGEDQASVHASLIALLKLVVENISVLVVDERWLSGQLAALHQAFIEPLDIRALDELERRLRDVIDRQGKLKKVLSNAQSSLRQMLAGFIDRLADMSDSASTFRDTLELRANQIEQAEDLTELTEVVANLLHETRVAQESARRSSEDLNSLRNQVDLANAEIARLQSDLLHTSEMVRHDPLTGVLNRKGLDEALQREIASARRRSSSLCIGLLDVDNFKRINDSHGHRVGDAALRHLADVIRDTLRPQDILGRFGGEEFIVILPNTSAEDAVIAMQRLQRALTNQYFLTAGERLLITFSAGVARLGPDEDAEAAIDRADKAMYRAKKAGRNRVLMA